MLRFTIVDYTQDPPVSTVIDEPVGLDSVDIQLKRTDTGHGFMDAVDSSFGGLKYYGNGHAILYAAYQARGLDAVLMLQVDCAPDDSDVFTPLYNGQFGFDSYKWMRGIDGCYSEASLDNGTAMLLFRNRGDHEVSLDTLVGQGVGGVGTTLTKYDGLGKEITLHPQLVRMVDYATIDTTGQGSNLYSAALRDSIGNIVTEAPIQGQPGYNEALPSFDDGRGNTNQQGNEIRLRAGTDDESAIITPFSNIRSSEFGSFPGLTNEVTLGVDINSDGLAPSEVFQFTPDILYADTKVKVNIDISGVMAMADEGLDPSLTATTTISAFLYKGLSWGDVRATMADGKYYNFDDARPTVGACKINAYQLRLDRLGIPYSPPNHVQAFQADFKNKMRLDPTAGVDWANFRYVFPNNNDSIELDGIGLNHNPTLSNTIVFQPGEKLWLLFKVSKSNASSLDVAFYSHRYQYRNTFHIDPAASRPRALDYSRNTVLGFTTQSPAPLSYVQLVFNSQYKATKCLAYMVNEAMSRTCEIITDGVLQVYSDYFGRTDAQPTPSATDGFGGLECITNGLLVRGYSAIQAYYMGYSQFVLNGQSGDYLLDIIDANTGSTTTVVLMENFGATTLTIPTNAVTAFAIGTQIIIEQGSVFPVNIAGMGGVSLNSPSGRFTTNGFGSQVLLTKIDTDSWLVGAQSPMVASWKGMLAALSAVHAVGYGLEADPNRAGFNRIRVEPIEYFYQDVIVATCDNVEVVEVDTLAAGAVAQYKGGYAKWEAEEAMGLDEVMTGRTWRTGLSQVRGALEKVCKYVASGYAIEATRRRLGTSTKDWRYDHDTFLVCLQRGFAPDGGAGATVRGFAIDGTGAIVNIELDNPGNGYTVPPNVTITTTQGGIYENARAHAVIEPINGQVQSIVVDYGGSGYDPAYVTITITPGTVQTLTSEHGNVGSPSNMIDPETVYNLRISPMRNAIRWLRYVLSSFGGNWATAALPFVAGTGNYFAAGHLASDPPTPATLGESMTLLPSMLPTGATPIWKSERVKFKYPMSYEMWQSIYANPYGKVRYSVNGGPYEVGYIAEVRYDLYKGLGEFTLKPAY